MFYTIEAGFTRGFVEWMVSSVSLPVHVATHGETKFPSRIYVALNGRHIKVERGRRISPTEGETENGLYRSISYLFRSDSKTYRCDAVAGLLIGIGRDNA